MLLMKANQRSVLQAGSDLVAEGIGGLRCRCCVALDGYPLGNILVETTTWSIAWRILAL